MEALGTDLILVCSSVSPDAVDDDGRIAEQLHTLAERAAARGMRVSYEALAWGRHVNTYDRSWEIVRRADHPALGLCVDSFHILSRGSDPAGIRDIPGEKLFFLQLADAPHMDMNVLQWSRHHRLFPGQGAFDLPAFLGHVLAAGYDGPLSLEVFNDVFRQADPRRAAVDALRSLLALAEAVRDPAQGHLPPASRSAGGACRPTPALHGFAFAELAVDDECEPAIARTLTALGFRHAGTHRTKPVQLWSHGEARVLLNAAADGERPHGAAVAALGVEVDDPQAAAERATRLLAPVLPRTRGPAEADLSAVAAPDGTSVFFCRTGAEDGWLTDFPGRRRRRSTDGSGSSRTSTTWRSPSRSTTSTRPRCSTAAVLGPATQHASEVAAPFGLVRNRTVADAERTLRLGLSVSVLRRGEWAPGVAEPQHVAFACTDVLACARAARAAGAPLLAIPDNYYDDLDARLAPPPDAARDHARARRAAATATGTASSCTSTPRCWAGGCSSRSCSASGATRGTARSTPRSGWPRTAGCACDDAGVNGSDGRSGQRKAPAVRQLRAGQEGACPARRRALGTRRAARVPGRAARPARRPGRVAAPAGPRPRAGARPRCRRLPAAPCRAVRARVRRHPDRGAGAGVEPAALAAADLRGRAARVRGGRGAARPHGHP